MLREGGEGGGGGGRGGGGGGHNLARPRSWDRDRLAETIGSSSSLLWTVFLPDQLVFAFQCHPPAMAQLVDKSIAIAEDIGIRDAKKSDVEPGAILLFLHIAGFLFFRLMDGAVDLNRQTYLREEEVYDPSSTDHMLRVETTSQRPVVKRIEDSGSRRSAGVGCPRIRPACRRTCDLV